MCANEQFELALVHIYQFSWFSCLQWPRAHCKEAYYYNLFALALDMFVKIKMGDWSIISVMNIKKHYE